MIKKLQMHFVEIYFILKKVKDRRKNESQYFMIWQLFSSIYSCYWEITATQATATCFSIKSTLHPFEQVSF